MLYAGMKKDALEIQRKAVEKYNTAYETVQKQCDSLYTKRKTSITLIEQITELINSIANSPKEFGTKLIRIREEQIQLSQTAVATPAPSAAMWTATPFLLELSFAPDVNIAFANFVVFARCVGASDDRILKTETDIDRYFMS